LKTFGQLLEQYMEECKLTLWGLAEELEKPGGGSYTAGTVSKWIHGKHVPPADIIEQIEDLFHLPGVFLEAAGCYYEAEARKGAIYRTKDETEVSVDLLQRWKEQLRYLTPSQLLEKFGIKNAVTDLLRQVCENQDTFEIYQSTQKVHHEIMAPAPGRVMAELEEKEPLFKRLRQQFAGNRVGELYELWGHEYYSYIDAFSLWFNNLEEVMKTVFMGAVDEELVDLPLSNGLFALKEKVGGDLDQTAKFRLEIQLSSLIVGCDLLALGFQELSSDSRWFFEIDRLHSLRVFLILIGEKLIKGFKFEDIDHTRLAQFLFEYPGDKLKLRAETTVFLEALKRLEGTQAELTSLLSQ